MGGSEEDQAATSTQSIGMQVCKAVDPRRRFNLPVLNVAIVVGVDKGLQGGQLLPSILESPVKPASPICRLDYGQRILTALMETRERQGPLFARLSATEQSSLTCFRLMYNLSSKSLACCTNSRRDFE